MGYRTALWVASLVMLKRSGLMGENSGTVAGADFEREKERERVLVEMELRIFEAVEMHDYHRGCWLLVFWVE